MPGAITAERLVDLLARPEAAELPVTDGISPLTVVELDAPGLEMLQRAGPASLPARVVVGIAADVPTVGAPALLDVALCGPAPFGVKAPGWVAVDDRELATAGLVAACATNPGAAVTLAQLLRLNETAPLAGGVTAESFAYSMLLAGPEFAAWRAQTTVPPYRPSREPVLVREDRSTVTVTLNRPEVRNAYDAATRDALVDVLRGVLARPRRPTVVLEGSGPSFCSGGDLSQFGTTPDPVTAHRVRTARAPGLLLHELGATAVLHGACVGAGIELPAFCRRVVATADATFRLPEVDMGLIPGAGGTASILARIGRHRTAYLALTGAPLGSLVALGWGLVDEVTGS